MTCFNAGFCRGAAVCARKVRLGDGQESRTSGLFIVNSAEGWCAVVVLEGIAAIVGGDSASAAGKAATFKTTSI